MLLTPRYDGPDLLRLDPAAAPDPAGPLLRQRRRLATLLAGLDADGWAAPSRCDAWTVREVVAHLVDTDRFWAFSIASGRAGEPTRALASFDPVASPPQLVEAHAGLGPDEVLAAYVEAVEGLAAALEGLGGSADAGWEGRAEAPPGHIPLRGLALHALWDGWVHERDIAVPLGLVPTDEADEVAGCLLYAAALGPMFLAAGGSTRAGVLVAAPTDGGPTVRVEAGGTVVAGHGDADGATVVLRAPSVALVDALSFRGPLPRAVAADDRWILTGLGTVFEAPLDAPAAP